MNRPINRAHPEIKERWELYNVIASIKPSVLETETLRKIASLVDADPHKWKHREEHIDHKEDKKRKKQAKKERDHIKDIKSWLAQFSTDLEMINAVQYRLGDHWGSMAILNNTDGKGAIVDLDAFINDAARYIRYVEEK